MRHGKKFNHLGRKKGHREATLRNMANALFEHKRINTTLAKAKSLRVFAEPLITKAKDDTTHNRRVVFSYLQNKTSIKELFGPIREKVGDRPGGYLRIVRTGFRQGDAAETAMIEFVDFNTVYTGGKSANIGKTTTRRSRRTRRGGGAKTAAPAVATAATTAVVSDEEE